MTVESIKIDVSPGELIDKITILEIKSARMNDAEKLSNVRAELELLSRTKEAGIEPSAELASLEEQLRIANEKLWQIEDDIRDREAAGDFGEMFITLARAVYQNNDERARLKREINLLLGSAIVEEKSYKPY